MTIEKITAPLAENGLPDRLRRSDVSAAAASQEARP